ncbi:MULTISPECIES: hypothetical protein [unclassified Breznakia]|uniref:hypothetical protein n=1 Tax=unclassified Breznakia TaxID=2623764 RepID=UPI002473B493|nr:MULTISPECIES: hypothetical protein [unclassified Breznakia]MDH6367157.1 hypothetical protein [Breznakia sp. PH1-1]MDH6404256.1 hypothetical protein [Breznakia sp. PF1-11]MDH6412045.1 hypothetical protein [Breznakia sp. PFB1-11]MDH6414244.1 hypothetical protein [Breznakia sp. PFB1-14]MDH6416659.1 hypothetical protein [Breznakia sp. PFB1-4]
MEDVLSYIVSTGTIIIPIIVTAFASYSFGKLHSKNENWSRILEHQLNHVYLPIYKTMYLNGTKSDATHQKVVDITEQIIEDNLQYIPDRFLKAYTGFKNKNPECRVQEFYSYITTSYNVTRSRLGYPSKNSLSIVKYFSLEEKLNLLSAFIGIFLSIIVLFVFIANITYKLSHGMDATPELDFSWYIAPSLFACYVSGSITYKFLVK